jgi:hypothetical protein
MAEKSALVGNLIGAGLQWPSPSLYYCWLDVAAQQRRPSQRLRWRPRVTLPQAPNPPQAFWP